MSKLNKINRISIKDGALKATLEVFDEETADNYTASYANAATIHDEFLLAIRNLDFHLSEICGKGISDDTHVEGYYRQAFGDGEIITLYGAKRQDNKCLSNIAARIYLCGESEYEWTDRLLEDLSLCEREALLYIKVGKRLGLDKFVILPVDNNNVETAA